MTGSVFTAAAGFLRGVGNQVAVSVAASAIAAAVLALPAGVSYVLFASEPESAGPASVADGAWTSPVASDGKIRARHQDAAGAHAPVPARDGQGLFSPAAIIMPMALDWTQPPVEMAAAPVVRPPNASEPRARIQQAQALPPRRPAIERVVVVADTAPPLPITPIAIRSPESAPVAGVTAGPMPRRLLGVNLPGPVSRVGDAVSGAVGLVGAAGSWTLSRASDLLPRL